MEPDLEDEDQHECADSNARGELGPTTPPVRRWNRVGTALSRQSRKARKPEAGSTLGSVLADGIRRELKEGCIPGEDLSEGTQSTTTGSLIVTTTNSINGFEEAADAWEEIEFMVDSGAGATVVGPEDVRAVEAEEADHAMNYRPADGSLIQDQGKKSFNAQDPDEEWWNLSARVTQVHQPLLSVSEMVESESTVVCSPTGSYMEGPHGRRLSIESKNNTYHLKMWVPRDQTLLFHGQTQARS